MDVHPAFALPVFRNRHTVGVVVRVWPDASALRPVSLSREIEARMVEPVAKAPTAERLSGVEDEFSSAGNIGTRAVRGGLALLGRTAITQVLQIASSILLARLLVPAFYGEVAIAATITGFARMTGDLGLLQMMVVREKVTPRDLQGSSFIGLSVAVTLTAVVAIVGILGHNVLNEGTGGGLVTAVYGGVLITDALRLPPIVRLNRGLRFGAIGLASLAESVALYSVQIVLLLTGFGVWALVVAQYARSLAGALVYARLGGGMVMPRWVPETFRLLRRSVFFQAPVLLTAGLSVLLPLMVAVHLGPGSVGLWSWATVLATPFMTLLVVIQSILTPSLARMHWQFSERFGDAADTAGRVMAVTAAFGAGALVGLAPDVIHYVFGARWLEATSAVQADLIGLLPLALVQQLSSVMDARNRPRARAGASLIAGLVSVGAAIPLMEWQGITGVAIAAAIVGPAVDALILAIIVKSPVKRTLIDGVLIVAVVAGLSVSAARLVGSLPSLVGAGCVVALLGCGVVMIIDRTAVQRLWRAARRPTVQQGVV